MNESAYVQMIRQFRNVLEGFTTSTLSCRDDRLGHIVCAEAIDALADGNYGVGCVLLDPRGEPVVRGHNEVFWPRFRSGGHAEAVVLDRFETTHSKVCDLSGYMLFVSLEPCPMCLCRIIISGIGSVKFVAADDGGGMVRNMDALPNHFRRLARGRKFGVAECSPGLQALAREIFVANLDQLQAKLRKRVAL